MFINRINSHYKIVSTDNIEMKMGHGSGTSSVIIYNFNKEFKDVPLKTDVTVDGRSGSFVIPKGSLISNLPGGVFAKFPKDSTQPQGYDKNWGMPIMRSGPNLSAIADGIKGIKLKPVTLAKIESDLRKNFPKNKIEKIKDTIRLYTKEKGGYVVSLGKVPGYLNFSQGDFDSNSSSLWDHSYHKKYTLEEIISSLKQWI